MSIADQRRAPQLLGQVCSYWHSLPQLWTKIVFSEKTAVDRTTASILRNLLARSQNLPLSLSIVEGSNVPAVVGDGNTQFFEILWESRHRFKDLSLNFSPERVAHFLPRIFARDIAFPNLEFLSLVIHGGDIFPHVSGIDSVLRAFRHSPLLHSLDLWYQGSPTPPLSLSVFPWSQLTHLRICMGITLAETRNILLHCHGLESARISLGVHPGHSVGPRPISILPNLRELHLEVRSGPCEVLFEAFSFPNLQTLSLDVVDLSAHEFRRFYTRSGFQLRDFYLERDDDVTAAQALLFIESQPTLETITLVNCAVCADPALFGIFTHRPAPALPELKKLVLGLDFRLDGAALADMAESLSENTEIERAPRSRD